MTAKCEGVLININRESAFNICILYVYLKNYLIFIYIHVWRGAAIKKAWSSFYSSPCSGVWQTTASSVLLPFCRQRKLTSPPVLLHSPLIIWFYGVPSASWLSSVIFSSTVSHANQTKTKSPNCHLSGLSCVWHFGTKVCGEMRLLLGAAIGCEPSVADKRLLLTVPWSVLLSVSIITANRFMDKRATRRHLMKLGLQII